MNGRFYVGEWLVEPVESRLVRGSESAKLDPKAIQVLGFLADHPNEVLTKEQIFGAVWEGAFVSDEVLTTAIWGLRRALGDDAKEPRYIQTIPRRGYRLVAPVEKTTGEASSRWEPSPYPGLSPFSQRDASYFFGREREIEALWTKIHERNLLGLIGPSGAGKSSLLRAGLIPRAPAGWEVLLCQPRGDAIDRLAAAIESRGSTTTNALWVVDQFEELFTLNDGETQSRFSDLLGRAAQSGIHVLVSMRDDFLIRCHEHESLEPVFERLSPITALEGPALRKALVEPARAEGYRFEDESLVADILTEVSREKGALPLLAFAASKLWERRDREGRRLTREAYLSIGGVAGALAQHAEETLSEIGAERVPIVREIFRNLTTASGTRVPIAREELLTVFPRREEAEKVLGKLIDARLLTSAEGDVEVIHESLVSAWPRLVRWQAQDAEGAVLRDQLRQAARAWLERGRPEDLLWTGTSYRELALFRERYGGGLTATEEEFAEAATRLAGRRRRRRRIAVAALVATSIAVAVVTSSLWQRARAEALRAEAQKLLALAQNELEPNPTAALAYAIQSLELADTQETRRFALRVLSNAPTGIIRKVEQEDGLEGHKLAFSRNGEWLAVGGTRMAQLLNRDGREPVVVSGEFSGGFVGVSLDFSRRGDVLVTDHAGEVRLFRVPEGHEIERRSTFEEGGSGLFLRGDGFFSSTSVGPRELIRWWPVGSGESRLIGETDAVTQADVDNAGTRFAYSAGQRVYVRSLEDWESPPRIFEHPARALGVAFHPDGESLATSDESGKIYIWPTARSSERPIRLLDADGIRALAFSPGGRWLAARCHRADGTKFVRVWDLSAPTSAKPLLLMSDRFLLEDTKFDPAEEWLVTAESWQVAFWPLGKRYPRVFEGAARSVAFTPDGTTLLSAGEGGEGGLYAWPLHSGGSEERRLLLKTGVSRSGLDVDPTGTHVVVAALKGHVLVVPLAGGPVQELEGFSERTELSTVVFSPDGKRVAAGVLRGPPEEKVIRIWDLETGAVQVLGPIPGAGEGADEGGIGQVAFLSKDRILATGLTGLLLFDLRDGSVKVLSDKPGARLVLSRTGRFGFGSVGPYRPGGLLVRFDLTGSAPTALASYGEAISIAMDRTETAIATGSNDGVVRVGPVSGGEPHVLFGHKGFVRMVAFSPDGKWLATAGDDGIRLWPVPDITKTPPHMRPHAEFLAMLRSWTNMRAVRDETSPTGWKLEVGPFPGWAKLPEL